MLKQKVMLKASVEASVFTYDTGTGNYTILSLSVVSLKKKLADDMGTAVCFKGQHCFSALGFWICVSSSSFQFLSGSPDA